MRIRGGLEPGRAALVVVLAALALGACGSPEPEPEDAPPASEVAPAGFAVTDLPADSILFEERIEWARANGLDTLSMGATMAALGRTFVGAPYEPYTLELEGPERLIVNLRELDCVTFVENMLALARVLHAGTPTYDAYKRELVRIRYRDGNLVGYPSRLHYFSEWIANNAEKGIVENITRRIGGVQDTGAISFMTAHADAYRQLADSAVVQQIREIELTLSGRERFYIPEARIDDVASSIRDGDIIAATSTLEGLDIAHTGLALWVDGRLHLMHAPLVGSVVEISEVPLAERIQRIDGQDGIMVARPAEVRRTGG